MNQHPHEGRVAAVLKIIGRRWLLISGVVLGIMIVTFLINYFLIERTYEAGVKIIYPLKRGSGFIKSNLGALDIPIRGFQTLLETEPTIYNHIAIIQSRTVCEMVVDELDLTNYYKKLKGDNEEDKRRRAARRLKRAMSVNDSIKGAVVVFVKDNDPEMAAKIANTIIEKTGEYLIELYQDTQGRMLDFLKERRDVVFIELDGVEERLKLKKEETGILSIDQQADQMITSYAELEKTLTEAELEYRGAIAQAEATEGFSEDVREYLEAIERGDVDLTQPYSTYLLGGGAEGVEQPQPIAQALEDLNIVFLRRELSELELELATKRIAFTEQHPDVIVLQKQAADARKALNEELMKYYDATLATLEIEGIAYSAQYEVVKDMIAGFEERIAAYPADEQELIDLEREQRVKESVLLVVEQELEEAQIREKKLELPFSVLDEALPPRQPVGPRLIVNTVVAGGIAAWVMLYLVFWHETRIRRKEAAASAEAK
jgi:succinoglycan biosynthesis transport protein ExoP